MAFAGGADLGSAHGLIQIDTAAAQKNIQALQSNIQTFGTTSADSFKRVATGIGLLGASRVLAGLFSGAVSTAADFEAQISAIGAVADATAPQLEALRDAALRIGKDTSFSASEAASALEELLKAGVSVEDVLNGAADGATALAAAAGTGIPQAATLIANALNIFSLSGDQATHVADVFAAAANRSATSVEDLGAGMAQVGTIASGFGLSIEETAGALALFADNGLKGSDAGTSFKTALTSMLAPVGAGAKAIDALGLTFRDSEGNFIGMADAADELRRVLGPLTKAQRDAALVAIFGTDALRVGNILYKEGGDAVTEYTDAVNDQGAAHDAASKRLDNFNGSLEQLRGSFETLTILIGTTFLPALREIVDAITAFVNVLIALPHSFQAALGILTAGAAVFTALAGAMVLAGPKALAFADALKTIRVALLGTNPLLLAIVGALALLGVAYKTNFGGFADFVNSSAKKIGTAFKSLTADLHFFTKDFNGVQLKKGGFGKIVGVDQLTEFQHRLQSMGRTFNKFFKGLSRVADGFEHISDVIKAHGIIAGIKDAFGSTGQGIVANFGKAIAAIPETIGVALRGIRTGFQPLDELFFNAGRSLQFFGTALEFAAKGDFSTAFDRLRSSLGSLLDGVKIAGGLAIDLGKIVVTGVFKLAGDLAGDLRSFVLSSLFGTHLEGSVATGHGEQVANAFDPIQLGKILINATLELAGDLKNAASNVWGWVKDHFRNVADSALNLGSLAVSGTIALSQDIADIARDVWGWIQDHFHNALNDAIRLGTLTIDAAIAFGESIGPFLTDAWGWVKSKAHNIINDAFALGTLTVSGTIKLGEGTNFDLAANAVGVGLASAIADLTTLATDIGTAISNKIGDVNWATLVTADSFGGGRGLGEAVRTGIIGVLATFADLNAEDVAAVISGVGHGIAKAFTTVALIELGIMTSIASAIGGFFTGLVFGDNDLTWDGAIASITESFGAAFSAAITGGEALLISSSDLAAWAASIWTQITSALTGTSSSPGMNGVGVSGGSDGIFASIKETIANGLADLFPNASEIKFPPIGDIVSTWVESNLLDPLSGSLDKEWLKKLANGDVFGAVKALFGGSDSGGGGSAVPGDFDGDGVPDTKDLFPHDPSSHIGDFGKDAGGLYLKGVIKGLDSGKKDIANALDALTATASKSPGIKTPTARTTTTGKVKTPAPDNSALLKGLGTAVTATKIASAGIVATMKSIVSPMTVAGQQAGLGFALGIGRGMIIAVQTAAAGARSVQAAALSNLGSLSNAGFTVGQSLGLGIALGMASTVDIIIRTAAALVTAGLNSARNTAKIGSPSKLFADEVGQPIAQGIAVGINDGTTTVQRSIADLLGNAMPTSSATSMLGRTPTGTATASNPTNVTVVYAVKSDEMVNLLRQAERGDAAMSTWEGVPRAHSLVYGGAI